MPTFKIPTELEEAFRKKAYTKFGFKQGALKKAMLEAIKAWLKAQD